VDPSSRARHAYPRRPRTWHATGSSLPTRVRGNNVCHRRADLGELTNSRASAPEPRRNARASLGLVGEATATTDGGGGRAAGRVIPARSPHHCLLVLDSPTKPNQTKPRRKGRARHSHSHAPGRHVHTLRHSTSSVAPKHLDIFPRNPQAWAATTTSVSLSVVLFSKKKKLALPHGYDGGSPSDRGLPRRKRRVIFSVLPIAPPYIQISPYSYVRAPLLLPI
jgi:hypothetical protein